MRSSFWVVLPLLSLAAAAYACGEWPPKHGGQMNHDGGEVGFELVSKGSSVVLYLEDHGVPMPSETVKGTLSVRRGTKGWTAPLKPVGDNRMQAQVPAALVKGDEVVADISMANGTIAKGQFVFGVQVDLRTRFGGPKASVPNLPRFN